MWSKFAKSQGDLQSRKFPKDDKGIILLTASKITEYKI